VSDSKLGASEPKADGKLLTDGAKLSSAADGAAGLCADAYGAHMAANAANVAMVILNIMVRSSLLLFSIVGKL
jgi:hypothetical protein